MMDILEQIVWIIILSVLAFFVGVPTAWIYQFGILVYACTIVSIALIVTGVIKRKHRYGKVALIMGLLLWDFVGWIGLSAIS
jgi:hypothetical protein